MAFRSWRLPLEDSQTAQQAELDKEHDLIFPQHNNPITQHLQGSHSLTLPAQASQGPGCYNVSCLYQLVTKRLCSVQERWQLRPEDAEAGA